jgi:hypothetical protein
MNANIGSRENQGMTLNNTYTVSHTCRLTLLLSAKVEMQLCFVLFYFSSLQGPTGFYITFTVIPFVEHPGTPGAPSVPRPQQFSRTPPIRWVHTPPGGQLGRPPHASRTSGPGMNPGSTGPESAGEIF